MDLDPYRDKNNKQIKKSRTSSAISEGSILDDSSILQSFWIRCRAVFPNITDRKFMEGQFRNVLYSGILFWFIHILYQALK
jgi:hypothetical protein